MAEEQKRETLVYGSEDDVSFGSDRYAWPYFKQQDHSLFEGNPDAMAAFDLLGNCVRVNSALLQLSGYSNKEWRTRTFQRLFSEEDWTKINRQLQQAATGATQHYELQLRHKDGHCIDLKVTHLPIINGQIVGVYGIFKDNTQRNKTEGELRTTLAQLDAFLENSADAIWMINVENRVLQVNPAFESLFGWTEQEVLGGKLPIVPPSLAPEMEQLHQRIKAGHSVIGYETQRLCRDGRLIHVSATLSPLRDNEGNVIGISGTCRDISDMKQAEEEVRATKELFESIFNYTTDAVVVFDLEGRLLAMNPSSAGMSALHRSSTPGERFELHQDMIPQHVRHKYMDVLNGRSPFTEFELSRTLEDGRQFDLQVTLSPICNDIGEVSALLLMAKDITESKKTQEMLLQSEKLSIAGQLAAGVAHEIRNPLTALKGFVQLMKLGQGCQEKYLDVMASELDRIEMIVSELLVLAKPQAMTFKRKEIVPILEEVLTLSGTQAILHNVHIVSDFADILPALDCDNNQLKQVFINFIKNAIEAMSRGGELRIEAHVHGENCVRIRFADQGTGIPKEHLKRLGEPFYTTKTKGTGLGLMVSKKIIENHQGRLEIASELGVGTTVDVYLPIP
jgi:two-component system, sporulation sensor kinase A